MKFLRKIPYVVTIAFAGFASFCEVACSTAQIAQAEAVGASLVPLVQQGTVIAADGFAAYQSVNQNLTDANVISGKLSATKVLAGAQAIIGSSSTAQASQSLLTAVNTFVSDANSAIATYKAAGATTQATIAAVSQSGAATVTSIAAVAPTATTPATTSAPMWQSVNTSVTAQDRLNEKEIVTAARFKITPGLRSPFGERDPYHVLMARN